MRPLTLFALGLGLTLAGASTMRGQMIVAHRGASADAPENTLAAFRLAWELGADAAEGDFHLTADGHVVCHHDATTARTGGKDLLVTDATLAELRELEFGGWKAERFRGEPIPTLADMIATVPRGKTLYVEVKSGPEIGPALQQALSGAPLPAERVKIIAFDEAVIREAKRLLPDHEAYWLSSFRQDPETGDWSPSAAEVVRTALDVGADGVGLQGRLEVVDAALVRACREASLSVHVWTVDDPQAAREFARRGVASITTNQPDVIRRALD